MICEQESSFQSIIYHVFSNILSLNLIIYLLGKKSNDLKEKKKKKKQKATDQLTESSTSTKIEGGKKKEDASDNKKVKPVFAAKKRPTFGAPKTKESTFSKRNVNPRV